MFVRAFEDTHANSTTSAARFLFHQVGDELNAITTIVVVGGSCLASAVISSTFSMAELLTPEPSV